MPEEFKLAKGLMEYIAILEEAKLNLRNDKNNESLKEIDNLINQLTTIKLGKNLIYMELTPLEEDLNKTIIESGYYDSLGFPKDVSHYFKLIFNFMVNTARETDLLSNCIVSLLRIINDRNSRIDELLLKGAEEEKEAKDQQEKEPEEAIKEREVIFDKETEEKAMKEYTANREKKKYVKVIKEIISESDIEEESNNEIGDFNEEPEIKSKEIEEKPIEEYKGFCRTCGRMQLMVDYNIREIDTKKAGKRKVIQGKCHQCDRTIATLRGIKK